MVITGIFIPYNKNIPCSIIKLDRDSSFFIKQLHDLIGCEICDFITITTNLFNKRCLIIDDNGKLVPNWALRINTRASFFYNVTTKSIDPIVGNAILFDVSDCDLVSIMCPETTVDILNEYGV